MLTAKIAAARAVGELARRAGRGGGTSLPGKVLIALEPDAISELAARLARGSVVISATNGKTTTAAMVASVLRRAGVPVVHNRAGANMAGGVASTLLAAARSGGRIEGELGLFEIDEFWLDRIVPELEPRGILLGNLFRDQLDRYGELETIADRWAAVTVDGRGRTPQLVLNADDPLIADLGRGAANVTYFGVEDPSMAVPEMQHASDSKHCRRCGAAVRLRRRLPRSPGALPLPVLRAGAPGAGGGGRADLAQRHPRLVVRARHAGRAGRRRAAPPWAVQRLQRARRGGALPRAGNRARLGPRRAGRGAGGVRSRGAARDRGRGGAGAPGQESGWRQRDPAHARARGR